MFGKRCSNCDRKIGKDFEFCPYCGINIKTKKQEDYGMLGKEDVVSQEDPFSAMLGGSMMHKMIGGTIKMLERELTKELNEMKKTERKTENIPAGFELFINGQKINLGQNQPPVQMQQSQIPKKIPMPSQELIEKSKKLPRKEAKAELRRLGNSVTYEIEIPGIETLESVLVTKLEDSFEVKAFAEDKVYIKTIPIKLILIKYYLKEEKLFLEFKGK